MIKGCTLTKVFRLHVITTISITWSHVQGRLLVIIVARKVTIGASAHFLSMALQVHLVRGLDRVQVLNSRLVALIGRVHNQGSLRQHFIVLELSLHKLAEVKAEANEVNLQGKVEFLL